MRQPFYEIQTDAYLFQSKLTACADRNNPEEPVRQWCAHELIRAYGIPVGQLEFERRVRVGSKHYQIDVLISKAGVPWTVVECKEPGFRKHEGGIEQARSYAHAHEINAEFIIYTNGEVWKVERRCRNEWIPVPDLPKWQVLHSDESIVPLLRLTGLLKPLLHQLDRDISGPDAVRFLGSLQEFFSGSNLLTKASDQSLVAALDNLLRGICDPNLHANYRCGKLSTTRCFFEMFQRTSGLDMTLPPVLTSTEVRSEIHAIAIGVDQILGVAIEVPGESLLLLRLCSAILGYGLLVDGHGKRIPKISPEIYRALRDYLDHVLILHLNVSLPDSIDRIAVGDMRSLCEPSGKR